MNEYLTQDKKTELEKELRDRKLTLRPQILEKVLAAFDLGDLPENAEYESSRDEQKKNEVRIQYIEKILRHAQIIERTGSHKVELGATVVVKNLIDNLEKTFLIVGSTESDINQNKISIDSPLGKVLFGKTVGQVVTISTPRGDVDYEILSVV